MAREATPEVKAAIAKGAIADGVMLALGAVLWFATDDIAWLVGGFIIGSVAFTLLLAQAGAFARNDERR